MVVKSTGEREGLKKEKGVGKGEGTGKVKVCRGQRLKTPPRLEWVGATGVNHRRGGVKACKVQTATRRRGGART